MPNRIAPPVARAAERAPAPPRPLEPVMVLEELVAAGKREDMGKVAVVTPARVDQVEEAERRTKSTHQNLTKERHGVQLSQREFVILSAA